MAIDDPFELLGLEARYAIERADLDKVHRDLSKALHPDRHRDQPARERRHLLERAMQVNEAYRIVKDPVRRARALLRLRGIAVDESVQVSPAPLFLMGVIEQRESLAEARATRNAGAVHALRRSVMARREATERNLGEAFGALFSSQTLADPDSLLALVAELAYDARFLEEANAAAEELDGDSL